MPNTVFTMNSDSEWKKRRQAFRHAFNPVSLRSFDPVLNELVHNLCNKIDDVADQNLAIQIDSWFSRFALDVIFRVGFELDCDFLHDDKAFEVRPK
jgi:cytochrome P450